MLKIQNKSTKKIRVTLIIFFMIQVFLTSQSFYTGYDAKGNYRSFTVLDMVYAIFHHDASVDLLSKQGVSVMLFSLFLILPVIALGFQLFDFYYNLKNIVGFLVSFAGIIMVLNFVGLGHLGGGSLLTMIFYLFTAFMSVMGMMARYVKTPEEVKAEKEKSDAKDIKS